MNIFATSDDPVQCARDHCDVHVIKMILETAQLLSTAHHVLSPEHAPEGLYKKTHTNHPCAVWVRANAGNYLWAYGLFCALLAEYTYRYGRVHASSKLREPLSMPPQGIDWLPRTEPPQCMPDEYKGLLATTAYQRYIRCGKPFATWARTRPKPAWVA